MHLLWIWSSATFQCIFLQVLHYLNISVIWATMYQWWLTLHPVGLRLWEKFQVDWRKCLLTGGLCVFGSIHCEGSMSSYDSLPYWRKFFSVCQTRSLKAASNKNIQMFIINVKMITSYIKSVIMKQHLPLWHYIQIIAWKCLFLLTCQMKCTDVVHIDAYLTV